MFSEVYDQIALEDRVVLSAHYWGMKIELYFSVSCGALGKKGNQDNLGIITHISP